MSQAAHTSPPGGPLSLPDEAWCCGLGFFSGLWDWEFRTYVGDRGSAVEG